MTDGTWQMAHARSVGGACGRIELWSLTGMQEAAGGPEIFVNSDRLLAVRACWTLSGLVCRLTATEEVDARASEPKTDMSTDM